MHHVEMRKKAKHAYHLMHAQMIKARIAADKMDILKKKAYGHYKTAKHMLKITFGEYNGAVRAYKKSKALWIKITNKTKKIAAKKLMEHKRKWMMKIHVKWTKAKKTMKGFKVNMAKWRLRWINAKNRMARMRTRRAKAFKVLKRVNVVLGRAHVSLRHAKKYLVRMVTKKMHYMRLMIRARRNLSIQITRTTRMKKIAKKNWVHMKAAIKFFKHNVKKMLAARKAAKLMAWRRGKAVATMRRTYITMMMWKKTQVRAQRREHIALLAKKRAIRDHAAAYARYLLAIKARRHAYAKKQAAIRARRHAQLLAGGALIAQNRAEAKAAASVKRLARATRIMRLALKVKLAAERHLVRQAKLRKHAERVAFHHHRQAIRRERRAHAMYKLRLKAQLVLKASLRKLKIATGAAKLALIAKRHAEAHARRSMANDRRIIRTWVIKIVNATKLRLRAQRRQRIAHAKWQNALRLKVIALREAKAAHKTSRKAHKLMVHHRRLARIARRAMRIAHGKMKIAVAHKLRMIAYYKAMAMQHKLAKARFYKAHLAKMRAIKAYHLSVYHRKIAYKKRAWAIARKLHLIKLAKHAVIMAHRAMGRANHMKKLMIKAKNVLITVRHSYKIWMHKLKIAKDAAAKRRAHEKVVQLRVQLKIRIRDHLQKVVKEKNLRAIWLRLRAANRVAKHAIVVMGRRVVHWRGVYHRFNVKRIAARKIQARFIHLALVAKRRMALAIHHQKIAMRRRTIAIRGAIRAIAYKKKQWALRAKAEHMTRVYKLRFSNAIAAGRKHKRVAAHYWRVANVQRKITLKMRVIFNDQSKIRAGARIAHRRFQLRARKWMGIARKIKIATVHIRANYRRLQREKRRLDIQAADHARRTIRAKMATRVQLALKLKFWKSARALKMRRVQLERLARVASFKVMSARREHRRQVLLKQKMLSWYAKLTARNLRNAKIVVSREVRITRRAKHAKKVYD